MASTSDGGIWAVVPYGSFTAYTPALPQFYWDVYSAEQRIKHICMELHKMVAYANMLGENINLTDEQIDAIEKRLDNIEDGGLKDLYEQEIYQWIQTNMPALMAAAAKQVIFGLTDDGYFCAYVPSSWSDIEFDTGMVYGRSDYGRLLLRFDVDGAGVIDNTYSYSAADLTGTLARDIEACYRALFTDLDQLTQGQED